jgi:hypothetical protein
MRSIIANLTPTIEASGPHDFAVRKNKRARQSRCLRPSHPCLTFVTIAKRPFCVGRDANDIEVIWVKREWEYFCKGDSTAELLICPSGKISRRPGRILRARREMKGVAIAAADVSGAARRKMTGHAFGPKTRRAPSRSRRTAPAATGPFPRAGSSGVSRIAPGPVVAPGRHSYRIASAEKSPSDRSKAKPRG